MELIVRFINPHHCTDVLLTGTISMRNFCRFSIFFRYAFLSFNDSTRFIEGTKRRQMRAQTPITSQIMSTSRLTDASAFTGDT